MKKISHILALHGFMGSGSDWRGLQHCLPGVTWVCPDLPGHGQQKNRIAQFQTAEEMAQCLDNEWPVDPDCTCLVAYSWGGRVALQLPSFQQGLWAKVILLSTHFGLADPQARRARRQSDESLAAQLATMRSSAFAAWLQQWWRQDLFCGLSETLRETLIKTRLQESPACLSRVMQLWSPGTVPFPTLLASQSFDLLVGALDEKYLQHANEQRSLLPNLRTDVVSGASHMLHMEAPLAVAHTAPFRELGQAE
ncbi:MAG: alpha/beta fold hydrolase [Verrucomicrobiales bacterium]